MHDNAKFTIRLNFLYYCSFSSEIQWVDSVCHCIQRIQQKLIYLQITFKINQLLTILRINKQFSEIKPLNVRNMPCGILL